MSRRRGSQKTIHQDHRLVFSQSFGNPAARRLTIEEAGKVPITSLNRFGHPEFGLMDRKR